MSPKLTVILSTYNRPDTLLVALKSIQRQTFDSWKAIVIGDKCDSRTEKVVDDLDDSRVQYINLPVRCGEQSVPNSVGIALADTDYISFMNHDDILLSDHFDYAIDSLNRTKADIFMGRATFAYKCKQTEDGRRIPEFSYTHPITRDPKHFMTSRYRYFEPCSSWLLPLKSVIKVGFWRPAIELFRPPAEDWLLRGWRSGWKFEFGERISVLKFNTHGFYSHPEGHYFYKSQEHKYIDELSDELTADELRVWLKVNAVEFDPRDYGETHGLKHRLLEWSRAIGAFMYRFFGIDIYNGLRKVEGEMRGGRMDRLTKRRIGTGLFEMNTYDPIELLKLIKK